jgi:hypothetical protein
VSYPPEYRDLQSNRGLLENIATVTGGRVIDWNRLDGLDFFPKADHPTYQFRPAWPELLFLALCLFLFDVAIRRLAIEPAAVVALVRRAWAVVRRKPVETTRTVAIDRLRAKKVEVGEELQKRRFEADPERLSATAGEPSVTTGPTEQPIEARAKPAAPSADTSLAAPKEEPKEDSYANRLLRAKKQVWTERKNEDGPAN